MHHLVNLSVVITILGCLLQAQGADKYTDENRPYEFGFTIDGEQHRHEKKDENGLIMGEFGFITADGVYHVTVYATDENGNFKILSMKNLRVKPYPTAKEGKALQIPSAPKTPTPQLPASVEQPARSCSHCSIPTKAPEVPQVDVASRFNPDNNPQYPQSQPEYQNQPQYQNQPEYQNQPQYQNQPEYQNEPENQNQPEYNNQPQNSNYPNQPNEQYPQEQAGPQYTEQNLQPGDRNPKQYNPNALQKPQLISAQMQIVDRNTDINQRGPGEQPGLPNGLTKNDMKLLLYTFNYTVGFHGHHEEGYTDGTKVGYYFITGRNGVRTRVDYVADENGFRPKITNEILDILSDDVPKEETEKDVKYGLKGYEFRWIYYPVESRR